MKTLYLECNMGAAGDMLMAALLELHPDRAGFLERFEKLGIPGVKVTAEPAVKCGITGTHVSVVINGEEEESLDEWHAHLHGHEHGHDDHSCAEHEHGHDDHSCAEHEHGQHDHSYAELGHSHDDYICTEHKHDHDDHNHAEHEHGHHDHNHTDHDHSHHDHNHSDHHHNHDEHDHAGHKDGHHDHHGQHHHSHTDHDHAHGHHHHTGLHEIEHMIGHLDLPDQVRKDVLAVYGLIAEAESHAHGMPVDQIHFHEVGTMDAVADITGVCMLIHELAPDQVVASPVHVGCGQVRCAHGILPVPAPATAYILKDVPVYGGEIRGELCTPTGAALLKHFSAKFGSMPVMKISKIGYGMGKKEFERANCVRAMLGETEDSKDGASELCCNLDDMTPEAIGYAQEKLMEEGALDVYTVSIGMKKNRPGVMLVCMCKMADKEKMVRLLFRHTTTLGVREYDCARYTLKRAIKAVETPYGTVHIKESSGWDVKRQKPEYEDLARIAREKGISLTDAMKLVQTYL